MHSRTPLANTYDFNSIMLNSVCFGFFHFIIIIEFMKQMKQRVESGVKEV